MVGSGTEGWDQVHMEHFDRVALIPEHGEEGTVVGQERREGWGETEDKTMC